MASTAFFGTIRTAREFVTTLIDIDTKLVSISKVMTDDMDMAEVFDRATQSAETFGKSITEALDAYIEFARQGYKGEDLGFLADAGLVAANTGELSAQKASEYMTASLVQWDIDAKDSMKTIDSWNAISNNYATTVEKLAQGQTRAGATAKAMGLEFNELNAIIGTVTAATKQSGNEVGNFVKAALPRLLTDTGQDILGSLGVQTEDKEGRLRNTIDIYTDVAHAIKDLSEAEQVNVVKGLGGVYHQTRLQVLLDDLGSVDSMYRSMLETAENSEGSAMIENEKYMQSFEARINLLRVELEKLIVVVGEAFLTDGMLAFIQMAGNVLNIIAEITKTFGALPVILGVSAVALTGLSKRFRDLTTSIFTSTKSLFSNDVAIRKLTVSTAKYNTLKGMSNSVNIANNATLRTNSAQMAVLTATTQTATVATSGFGNALRGLALATGAGAAFVAVGFVLEKLIGSMGGTIKKSDELASANRILLESYSSNETEIDSLAVKYSELEKEMEKANPDSKKVSEYHDVMNQLGNLLPDLVTGEDQFGNKIIASSTATEIKIELLKEQLEIQKNLNAEQERSDTLGSIDVNSKAIEDAKKKSEDYAKMLTNMLTGVTSKDLSSQYVIEFTDSDGKPLMKSGEDIAKFIDDLKVKINEATKNGDTKDVSILNSQLGQMERYYAMIDNETKGVSKNISILKSEYIDLISQTVAGTKNMSDSTKSYADSFVASMLKISDGANVDTLGEGLNKLLSSDDSSSFVSNLSNEFNKLDIATEETFSSMSASVQSFIDKLPESLADSGLSDAEIKAIKTALQSMLNSSTADFNSFEDAMKSTGITLEQARMNAEAAGESMSDMGDDAQKAERDIEDLTDSISYINGVLEDYAESNRLSASTVMELIEKYPQLLAYVNDEARLIEELTKIRDQDISAAQKQLAEKIEMSEEYYNANLKMIEAYFKEQFKFYDGDLSQFQNLAQAKADVEKQLIEYLAKEWSSYYDTISGNFIPVMGATVDPNQPHHLPDGDISNYPNIAEYNKKANEANRVLQNMQKQFDSFTVSQINLDFTKIGTSQDKNTKSKDKKNKADKTNNKTTKESIYLTDEYRQALEKLNLEIEKQKAIQESVPEWSDTYIKSLEDQLKLENEILTLQQNQSKEIQNQIKTGRIKKTGTVTSETVTSTKLSGWSGAITSKFGGKRNNPEGYHTGIDIDGAIGDLLQANVAGKVVETGKNSRSGNYVKIKSSDGNTHYYVHMDSIKVEKGQTVSVGTNIGTIGNTGNVVKSGKGDGSHLHYEVRNSKGTPIDPTKYVNTAKSNANKVSKEVLSTVDKTQEAIDEAKLTVVGLETDILARQKRITEIEAKMINSVTSNFDRRRATLDDEYAHEEAKLKTLDKDSEQYNKTLEKQASIIKRKQNVNQEELDYYNGLIEKGDLSVSMVRNLDARILKLKGTALETSQELQSLVFDKYDLSDEKREVPQNKIDLIKSNMEMMDSDSIEYANSLEEIVKQLYIIQEINQEDLIDLENDIKSGEYTGEVLEQLEDDYQALKLTIQETNAEIRDTFYQASEVKFNINDKAIGESQKKIDFLSWQLGLLGEEDHEIKIKIYTEMQTNIKDSLVKIDKGISDALVERTLASSKGYSTAIYDTKIEDYVSQRRNQLGEMQSIYNNMQSMVASAFDKIAQAEANAYNEASQAIDRAIRNSEKRIDAFGKVIARLDKQLETLQESDFTKKTAIIEGQLTKTREMVNAIIAEYDVVASTPVYNEDQQATVESKLEDLKVQLDDANSSILEYTRTLEQTHFDSIVYGAKKASEEIERLNNKLNKNLQILDRGMLSGTELDFSTVSVTGKTLDLGSLINNPLSEKQAQIQIQDIRSSSYGQQIRDAEAFHAEMQAQAEKFQKIMAEEQKKFEENIQLLMKLSAENKEKEKKKEADALNKITETMTKEEFEELKNHYMNLQTTMSNLMNSFKGEYSSIWASVVAELQANLATMETAIANAKITPSSNTSTSPSKPATEKPKKYASGTKGHPGGLAYVGDRYGRELIVYPDGTIGLSNDTDQLVNLPKGTHVIPNKETEKILSGQNIPKYANGTNWDMDRLKTDSSYWLEYLKENSPKGYNTAMDEINGYGGENYYRDRDGVLIDKTTGTSVNTSIHNNYSPTLTADNQFYEGDTVNYGSKPTTDYSGNPNGNFNVSPTGSFYLNGGSIGGIKNGYAPSGEFLALKDEITRITDLAKSIWDGKVDGNYNNLMKQLNELRAEQIDTVLKELGEGTSLAQLESIIGSRIQNQHFASYREKYTAEDDISQLNNTWEHDFAARNNKEHYKFVVDYMNGKTDSPIAESLKKWIDEQSDSYKEKFLQDMKSGITSVDEYFEKRQSGWSPTDSTSVNSEFVSSEFANVLDDAYKDFTNGQIAKETEQGTIAHIKNLASSKVATYSDSFIEKYNPYAKEGSNYAKSREPALSEISGMQTKLSGLKDSNGSKAVISALVSDILSKQEELNKNDSLFIIESLDDLAQQRAKLAKETRDQLAQELEKGLLNGLLTEDAVNYYREEISNLDNQIADSVLERKSLYEQGFNIEQALRDKRISAINKEAEELQFILELTRSITPFDYAKTIPTLEAMSKNAIAHTEELSKQKDILLEQMELLEVGSFEWNLLNQGVEGYTTQIRSALLAQQKLSKDILTEQFNSQLRLIELQIFGGKTEEDARKALEEKYKVKDKYVDGLEKELETEKLILFAKTNDVKLSKEELALLNSKDKIEKKALERLQKQLEIRALEQKLLNLNMEKNIQQLTKQADGTWDYQYVVDQDAIDETHSQLKDKQLELIRFEEDTERQREQDELSAKSDYYNKIKNLANKALNGEITDFEMFSSGMKELNSSFLSGMSVETSSQWENMYASVSSNLKSMEDSFRSYVANIQALAAKVTIPAPPATSNKKVYSMDEFKNLSKTEMKNALKDTNSYISYNGKEIKANDLMNMSDEELKRKYGFANGGMTKSTGLHWLDGTLAKPEIVLNPNDTQNLLKAVDIASGFSTLTSLPKLTGISSKTSTTEQTFHISKLEFPNVKDSSQIQDAIKNLPSIAISRVRKN